jgi:hypothetical protein
MSPIPKPRRRALSVSPSEEHARIALREVQVLMAPLVRWLLRHGVHYGAFANVLKQVFVSVAREELAGAEAKVTDSAISVLSGVHRKDVRTLGEGPAPAVPRSVPLASQVFTRWLTDARYCSPQSGQPLPLARSGREGSFEALSREVSTDVHPRTVLDELLRLGLVEVDGERVVPRTQAFVPADDLDELTALFSANVADHIAAAVHNLTEPGMRLLEQSVYAEGLAPESARQLAGHARALWAQAFASMVEQARARVDADRAVAGSGRMRFGVYYYADPVPDAPAADSDTTSGGRQ